MRSENLYTILKLGRSPLCKWVLHLGMEPKGSCRKKLSLICGQKNQPSWPGQVRLMAAKPIVQIKRWKKHVGPWRSLLITTTQTSDSDQGAARHGNQKPSRLALLWGDASRTRPWGWFWNPFLGTGNNIVLRFFGHLIFAQAARSIGGQWLLSGASAVWPCHFFCSQANWSM